MYVFRSGVSTELLQSRTQSNDSGEGENAVPVPSRASSQSTKRRSRWQSPAREGAEENKENKRAANACVEKSVSGDVSELGVGQNAADASATATATATASATAKMETELAPGEVQAEPGSTCSASSASSASEPAKPLKPLYSWIPPSGNLFLDEDTKQPLFELIQDTVYMYHRLYATPA